MGRHSDPDPRWFWLSLGAAGAKALVLVALLAAAVFALVSFVGDGDDETGTVPASSPTATAASPPLGLEEQTAAPPAEQPATSPAVAAATVQVLDASGLPGALEQAVAALERLGIQVVTSGRAVRGYERTTVFWSAGFQARAEELRAADPRFGVIEANERLDPTIDLHVVVGADWSGEAPQSPSDGT